VEVALTREMADAIPPILATARDHPDERANSRVFYSISTASAASTRVFAAS